MRTPRYLVWTVAASLALTLAAAPALAEEPAPDRFDGLEKVKSPRVAMAYVDPDADFSSFTRIAILDPLVAFRANWQRDQNRSRSRNISSSNMDRIKSDVAHLFRDVFIERLQNAGYAITTDGGEHVLVLRPAIIDLDITAPDTMSAGRNRTFTTTNGAATLYLELLDADSGDLLGRAADRQVARSAGGMMTWNNRVTNTAEARRMFGSWADKLIEFLHEHYQVTPPKPEAQQ